MGTTTCKRGNVIAAVNHRIALRLIISAFLFMSVQTPSSALDKSNNFERFFAFVDASALTPAEQKNLSANFHVKSFCSWKEGEKLRIQNTLKSLLSLHRIEIEALSYNETVRLFRTHDSLVADRNQNSLSAVAPTARSSEHDILFTDDYLMYEKKNTDDELLSFLAHELGHVVDAEDALSTSPAWVSSELPKLNKYHALLQQNTRSKHKIKDSAIVETCALPSQYGSRNLTEDFAETFAQYLCAKNANSSRRYSAISQLVKTSGATRKALQLSILAARADARDEHEKAVQYMNEALKLCPNVGTFYAARASYRKSANLLNSAKENLADLKKAEALYKTINLPMYASSLRTAHSKMATAWQQLGQYKRQKLELLWLTKSDPDDADALVDLADCCLNMNDATSALAYADKAVLADSLSAAAYRVRASAKIESKNYSSALKDLKLALLIEPGNNWALFHESECFYYDGNQELARQAVLKLLKAEPKNLDASRALCLIDFETGEYERCIKDCDAATTVQKRDNVDSIKAYALVKLGRFEQGRAMIVEALRGKLPDKRDLANAYLCLAEAEIGLNHKSKAMQALQKGEPLQPTNTNFQKLTKVINAMK